MKSGSDHPVEQLGEDRDLKGVLNLSIFIRVVRGTKFA